MTPYLLSMSNEELLRYAEQVAITELEQELVRRYNALHDNAEEISYVEDFKDAVWNIADALADTLGYNRTEASEELFDAIEKFEEAQR